MYKFILTIYFQNNPEVALNMLDLMHFTHDVPPLHTPAPLSVPTEQPLFVFGLTMFPVLHTAQSPWAKHLLLLQVP